MIVENEEMKYFIREGNLYEDNHTLGVRQLTHIKRIKYGGWSGPLEVRVHGLTIELWGDENLNNDLDFDVEYESSYDKLLHELRIDDEGGFRGEVNGEYIYSFVYTDKEGVVTEDFSDGKHLSKNKIYPPPNPLLGRILTLLNVGYVVDENWAPEAAGAKRRAKLYPMRTANFNFGDVDIIELKHPSSRKLQLRRDGSLREEEWTLHSIDRVKTSDGWVKKNEERNSWEKVKEGSLHIAPDDRKGFSVFIASVPKPKLKFWQS